MGCAAKADGQVKFGTPGVAGRGDLRNGSLGQ